MFLAAVDGAVMTMCDVGMDPVFVHNGYWTWLGPKETLVFFGVPQQVSGPPTPHTPRLSTVYLTTLSTPELCWLVPDSDPCKPPVPCHSQLLALQ